MSNSSYEQLGKGIHFPIQRLSRELFPLKWSLCFWILHLAGQLHKYLHFSKLCMADLAQVWIHSSLTLLPTPHPSAPQRGAAVSVPSCTAWHWPQWGPARDGCVRAETLGPQEAWARSGGKEMVTACTLRISQSFLISKAILAWGQNRNENRLTCLLLKGTSTQCSLYLVHASRVYSLV